jgi:hypothetical protein
VARDDVEAVEVKVPEPDAGAYPVIQHSELNPQVTKAAEGCGQLAATIPV